MKKIYLSLLCLTTLSVGAQMLPHSSKQGDKFASELKTLESNILPQDKALGTPIWTNDFSTPSDWLIDNNGKTDPGFGWEINATEDSWAFSSKINSTSGGNFAELSNGSPNATPPTQALGVTYTLTTAEAIDIQSLSGTSANNVSLTFLQYGARFNDAQNVYISTDNQTTWTLVGGNSDILATTSTSNNIMANPTKKTINLAPYLTGSYNSVYIRFSWTTAYPSSASNPNVWVAYGWMIDDVKIMTNSDYDLVQTKVLFGSVGKWGTDKGDISYYKVPKTQIAPIDFGGIITNNGSSSQSDIVFNTTVSNVTNYKGESLSSKIDPGVTDTLWIENQFTPEAVIGTKTFTFSTTSSATDDVPSNNGTSAVTPIKIAITENTYAVDNGTKNGTYNNGGKAYEIGNVFDVFADQKLYSVDVTLDATTPVNTLIYAVVYSLDLAAGSSMKTIAQELDRSDDFVVTAGKPGTTVTLELSNSPLLSADSPYLIVVGSAGGNAADLVVGTAGKPNPGVSWIKDELGEWYYLTSTPMVRMNFQNSLGLSELNAVSELSVYPNPANTNATLSYELKNESLVKVSINDLTGKTIYNNDLGSVNSGSHNLAISTEDFANGIYLINFEVNGGASLQKLVVKK